MSISQGYDIIIMGKLGKDIVYASVCTAIARYILNSIILKGTVFIAPAALKPAPMRVPG